MKTVSITEARAHFSRILREVERGETFVITRNGRAVARIESMHHDFRDAAEAIDDLRRYRSEHQIRLGAALRSAS